MGSFFSKGRRALLGVALALASLAFALWAAEWGMRRLRPDLLPSSRLHTQPDARIGWRFQPNQRVQGRSEWGTPLRQRTNALGFPDGDHAEEAAPGTRRIAFLGDSFTAAVGVDFDESFVQVAGRELQRVAPQEKIEVLNFGVPGMGTVRELLVWRHVVAFFRPEAVVLAFFLGNDVANNATGYEETMAARKEARRRSWFYRAFLEPSVLYQQFKLAQRDLRRAWRFGRGRRISPEDAGKPFWERSYAPLDWRGYLRNPEGTVAEAWKITESAIVTLRDEVEAAKARFVVLLIPGAEAVMPEEFFKALARHPGIEATEWDPDYPRRRLIDFFASHRIAHVDLTRTFASEVAEADRRRLYFVFDQHFSPEGHRLAGRAIARALAGKPGPR